MSRITRPHKKEFWRTLLTKAAIWIVSEIVLNAAGTDNLADYSEFVFDAERFIVSSAITTVATPLPPLQIKADTTDTGLDFYRIES